MDKTNKKVLAIASAVGVFLLAIILGLVFVPGKTVRVAEVPHIDELSRELDAVGGVSPPTIITEAEDSSTIPPAPELGINLKPQAAPIETPDQTVKSEPVNLQPPTVEPKPRVAPVKPATPPPVKRAPPKRYKVVQTTAYWIQAGSFSSMERANQAVVTLAALGLGGSVETYETPDSNMLYRVRVGAWKNRKDADKFKERVGSVAEFNGAFVFTSVINDKVAY